MSGPITRRAAARCLRAPAGEDVEPADDDARADTPEAESRRAANGRADQDDDVGAMLAREGAFGFPVAAAMDRRRAAKLLYWSGWRLVDIAELLGLPEGTIASWKHRDKWDEAPQIERVEAAIESRFVTLVYKNRKTGQDFKEIDLLGRQIERLARVRRYEAPGGHEGDLNPKVAARNAGPKKQPKSNLITALQAQQLREAFEAQMFDHQGDWLRAAETERTRMILKSRQIGATHHFSGEATCDAADTGRNQVFLSASKAQAHLFKNYIVDFVFKTIGVKLTGDPIIINREGPDGEPLDPATLYFLGTNFRTAQGYHGSVYFDEFFWVHSFEEIQKVFSAVATQKYYRKTYFSTPSTVTHPAYELWTGARFNKHRSKAERVELDVSHAALRQGRRLLDRAWRQIVTVEDAVGRGFDRIDIEDLRFEYPPDQFDNLFLCNFVDDTKSVFPLAELQRCQVDAMEVWDDFDWKMFLLGRRPFGHRRVWVGYDPSATGDAAALIVVAPPAVPGGKFRLLEKLQFTGMDFTAQAEAIRQVTRRYNVEKIDIDKNGIGLAVYQLVLQFFPQVRGHLYNPEVKTRLVLKAKDVIANARLEYDAGWTDFTAACMAIRKALTASGRQATYEAGRSALTGHADLFWAFAHAVDNEPLEAPSQGERRGFLEIY